MDKFYNEFETNRIDQWKNKYIKLYELRKLVKLIVKDIQKHGGIIERNQGRSSFEDTRPSKLDRRSIGLSALEDNENLFDKNDPIFQTPLMYDIDKTFQEMENFIYIDDIKIFLYFLQIEIHNVYVFYINIEKDIFNKTNEHLYKLKDLKKMNADEVCQELAELTEIAYTTYLFYLYTDLNIEAINKILDYFDDHFKKLNNNTALNKIFFEKYLSKKESDLKYILTFKIVIESTVLLESYSKTIFNLFPNDPKIKKQREELEEVLEYLIEKNLDRLNDDIYEVYIKNKTKGISKRKKNIEIDIQNCYYLDLHKDNYFLQKLGEKNYDAQMKIQITFDNKKNLSFLFFYVFLYSFFFTFSYLSLFFYYYEHNEEKNGKILNIYKLGIIISSMHTGAIYSRYISIFIKNKFKFAFILYSIFFMMSFIFLFIALRIIQLDKKNETAHFVFMILSRFFYGLSNERIFTRKYLLLFTPESKISSFTMYFLLDTYLSYILGGLFIFFIHGFPEFNFLSFFHIEKYFFLYFIGFLLSIVYLLLLSIIFKDPNKDDNNMLIQENDENENLIIEDNNKESYVLSDINNKKNEKLPGVVNIDLEEETDNKGKVYSVEEMKGLNSIEKGIINMNNANSFNDANLVNHELEIIKKMRNYSNSVFRKSCLVFLLSIFFSHNLNEYMLLMEPLSLKKRFKKGFEDNTINNLIIIIFVVFQIFSFPFLIFIRILTKFDIERKLLLIFYIIILCTIVITSILVLLKIIIISEEKILLIYFLIFIINNCIDGATHLLIDKIIPPFVKFFGINIKYIFAYSIFVSKAFGGLNFYVINLMDNDDSTYSITIFGVIIACVLISLLFSYTSLKVRAFAKLRYGNN